MDENAPRKQIIMQWLYNILTFIKIGFGWLILTLKRNILRAIEQIKS